MSNTVVTLKKGSGRYLKNGGAWIFDNEIGTIMGHFTNGDVVMVRDFDGYPLGRGYINQNSRIRVRMMTRNIGQEIDEAFLRQRLQDAWNYRKDVIDVSSCRLVFGEADFLPGIVVDKYEDILVVQSLTLGIDRFKEQIISILKDILAEDGIRIRGVYERSDAGERRKEGMEPVKGFLGDPFDTKIEIRENGVRYKVDVKDGQKTGFFLDQKLNRKAAAKLCRGREVLDCFTHMGTFALNAGLAGARHVTGIDISEYAVRQARENAALNQLEDRVEFAAEDVFDALPRLYGEGRRFDVVILDPPAFAKSKNAVKKAMKGYREINRQGLRLVRDGGYLATCSCSHFMTRELFEKAVREAAAGARRRLRQVEFRTQAPDHPILWAADESSYLKFFIFQVVDER